MSVSNDELGKDYEQNYRIEKVYQAYRSPISPLLSSELPRPKMYVPGFSVVSTSKDTRKDNADHHSTPSREDAPIVTRLLGQQERHPGAP